MILGVMKGINLYGAGGWGWERQPKIHQTQLRYINWVLGLDNNTPTYILLKETKRDDIWATAGSS